MKNLLFGTLLALAGFFLSNGASAQALVADTVFHFNYHDAVNGMIVTDSGECILVGKMETDSLTPKNIWVRRLGFQGDTLVIVKWEKIFYPQNASRVSKVRWTQDGNFIIAGSWNNNSMVLKMSPEGDSLSTLFIAGTADTYFQDVIELQNTDLVALQLDVNEDLYSRIMRISATGSQVWDYSYYDRYYSSLEYFNEDSMFLAGYEYHQEYKHILMGAYTPDDGAVHFNNMYQDLYGYNYCMAADSAALYLGNSKAYLTSPTFVSQLVRMRPDGEVEWEVDFTGIGSEMVKDIFLYDDYILTASDRAAAGKVIIGAIAYDGVPVGAYTIQKPIPYITAVDAWQNYVFITGRQFNGPNGRDIFFMKLNLDSMFVIIGTGQREYALDNPVRLYPNPVSDQLQVEMDKAAGQGAQYIRVFSMTGRLEYEASLNGALEHKVDVRGLEHGLYLVSLYFKDQPPVTRKVLVIH